MRTWLKIIGSHRKPITKAPHHGHYAEKHIGFRKDNEPSISTGDQLFLYASGGSRRIFALAEALGNPERNPKHNQNEEGSCRWRLRVRYLHNSHVDSGILLDEVSSDRHLDKSIQRASHIELRPEEYQSAYGKLMRNNTPVCVDLPVAPNFPDRVATTVSRILRDSVLVATLKWRYNFGCQICGTRLELPNGFYYCEAHHVRPLGAPHDGPDEESNLVIVCPNHHVLLDYGAIPLSRDSLVACSHHIAQAHLNYHNTTIHKSPTV
jgi:predicted restriction endonuclease